MSDSATEFRGPELPPNVIPDDLTTVQFILDSDTAHAFRPPPQPGLAWFVEDATGRELHGDEVGVAGKVVLCHFKLTITSMWISICDGRRAFDAAWM